MNHLCAVIVAIIVSSGTAAPVRGTIFKAEITIGDILTTVVLIIASTGLWLTYCQMKRGNRQKRAESIINLYNHYWADENVVSMFYEIDYGRFRHEELLRASDKEKSLDKLLGFFVDVETLYQLDTIEDPELKIIEYEVLSVYKSSQVKSYLESIDDELPDMGLKDNPYEAFRTLGARVQHLAERA